MKRILTARWNSKCAETGKPIKKYETMLYDYATKSCYSTISKAYAAFNNQSEPDAAAGMIQANEEAYFDNFCYSNNI